MVDEATLNCLRESEIDTIESSLKTKMEELISAGEIEQAEAVEDTINSLDHVSVCEGERLSTKNFTKHFESMMRDRARYL